MQQTIIQSPSSSNTTYILSGELKKQQSKNNKDDAILFMDITSRVICIQNNNNVSSVASDLKSVIQKLKDDNGNTAFHAVISSQESDDKGLAHLSKLKVVKKNGKDILTMTASANKFHASGKCAQNSINLNNIPEGETTITLLSELRPLNLNLIQENIDAILARTRLFATLNLCFFIVDYFNFPGVENRGQRWFLLGRRAVDGVIVAVDINGRCNSQSDNTYFMYRSDRLNVIQFRTSELRTILTNPINFNPPLSEEEYNRWVRNHGNVNFGLSPFS